MATSPIVSIIFVNYRSLWDISLALKSLFLLEKGGSFEVIVVNNDARDQVALERLAKTLPFRLIIAEGNNGFGAGANRGAIQAQGEVFGFINPDILWKEPVLGKIGLFFKNHAGILGATLFRKNGQPEAWSSGTFPSMQSIVKNKLGMANPISYDYKPDWVSAAALFVSRECFTTVGGFDEDFFLYFEDVDFCFRARKCGWDVFYDQSVAFFHHGGRSFSSRASQKKYFYHSQKRYFRKYRTKAEVFLLGFFHRILFLCI